jgi:hypothetical protein
MEKKGTYKYSWWEAYCKVVILKTKKEIKG